MFSEMQTTNRVDCTECCIEEDNKWQIACVFHLATIGRFKEFHDTNKIVAQMEHANVRSREGYASYYYELLLQNCVFWNGEFV